MSDVGLDLPVGCPRDLAGDCVAMARITSSDGSSFNCCGMLLSHARNIPQDRFRVCWKNDSVDEMGDYDRRDVVHTVATMTRALAIDEEAGESFVACGGGDDGS